VEQNHHNTTGPGKSVAKRLIDWLAAVKVAVAIVVVTAIACVVGTLLPQGAEVERYLAKHPAATERMNWFGQLGLTHVFSAWWFIGLLCLLSASVMVCSSRRFATILRTSGYSRGRAIGSMLTHISFLMILGGAVVRGVWGQKGYVEFHEGQTVAQFVETHGVRPLPFAIHLAAFEIERYDQSKQPDQGPTDQLVVNWPAQNLQAALPVKVNAQQKFADFTITVLRYVPDFVVDMTSHEVSSRSNEPRNPALLVAVNGPAYHNHRWVFANYPGLEMHTKDSQSTGESPLKMVFQCGGAARPREITGPIKSFKSTLEIVDHEQVVLTRTIEVNSPLSYKGYTLYQSGYNPDDLTYTSLQVVKDPGIPVVYAGFGLMVTGLFVVFYLNPWINKSPVAAPLTGAHAGIKPAATEHLVRSA
jgi:cytochrome c biogenesis protein ResB